MAGIEAIVRSCPVEHFHVPGDPTCRPGGSGTERGALNGPHFHVNSPSCRPEPDALPGMTVLYPAGCFRPHHHVRDASWRAA